jgi:hypothetical protein
MNRLSLPQESVSLGFEAKGIEPLMRLNSTVSDRAHVTVRASCAALPLPMRWLRFGGIVPKNSMFLGEDLLTERRYIRLRIQYKSPMPEENSNTECLDYSSCYRRQQESTGRSDCGSSRYCKVDQCSILR